MRVTNYVGKEVAWNGAEAEALAVGLNVDCFNEGGTAITGIRGCLRLRDCTGLRDCVGLRDCCDLRDCTGLRNCVGLWDCCDLRDCYDLRNCYKLRDCYDLRNCTCLCNCTGLRACCYLRSCMGLRYYRGLLDCNGLLANPIAYISTGMWPILIRSCSPTIKIGCRNHTIDEWMAFTDEQIAAMHTEALGFWKRWKPVVQAALESAGARGNHA